MKSLVDTSVLVRYLTGDPIAMAERAAAILDYEEGLGITGVILAETAYVLTSVYAVPRDVVVDQLIELLQKENIHPADLRKCIALQALLLCRPSARVSFADAMLWATAHDRCVLRVYTFDERFPKDGIQILNLAIRSSRAYQAKKSMWQSP